MADTLPRLRMVSCNGWQYAESCYDFTEQNISFLYKIWFLFTYEQNPSMSSHTQINIMFEQNLTFVHMLAESFNEFKHKNVTVFEEEYIFICEQNELTKFDLCSPPVSRFRAGIPALVYTACNSPLTIHSCQFALQHFPNLFWFVICCSSAFWKVGQT